MSKTTEHIIKNDIDVSGYDGVDDDYFTGPRRLKIAYLHGLESKAGGPKVEWLKSLGHVVLAPNMDYDSDKTFGETELLLEMFEPDVIIGSSYGGRFAYYLGKKVGAPVILLNPALAEGIHPSWFGEDNKPSKVFLALGNSDDTIDPEGTVNWLNKIDRWDWNMNNTLWGPYGHRTPIDVFKNIFNHFYPRVIHSIDLQKRYGQKDK